MIILGQNIKYSSVNSEAHRQFVDPIHYYFHIITYIITCLHLTHLTAIANFLAIPSLLSLKHGLHAAMSIGTGHVASSECQWWWWGTHKTPSLAFSQQAFAGKKCMCPDKHIKSWKDGCTSVTGRIQTVLAACTSSWITASPWTHNVCVWGEQLPHPPSTDGVFLPVPSQRFLVRLQAQKCPSDGAEPQLPLYC